MSMTQANGSGALIERVVAMGDLEGLKPIERAQYYAKVCESIGLNPLTQPFMYVKLNGKLLLYAKKDASDQLRQVHSISITILSRELDADGVLTVTARATMPSGRQDESIGCVAIGGLKGESLANAKMKAETKAKRRVTLSICGLGWLDETEVQDIKGAKPMVVTKDGEILGEVAQGPDLTKQLAASVDWSAWAARHLDTLRRAAEVDVGALNEAWLDVVEDAKKINPPKEFVAALNEGKNELRTSARKVAS